MPYLRIVLLSGVVLVSTLPGSSKSSSVFSGQITNVGSSSEFTVNTTLVRCTESTRNTLQDGTKQTTTNGCSIRYLGEPVTVDGKRDQKSGVVAAVEITTVGLFESKVEGSAVVDKVTASVDAARGVTVSAYGYLINIPASLYPAFLTPLTNQTEITPNLWLHYSGVQNPDGSVTAKHSELLDE